MGYLSPIGTCIEICERKLPAAILLHQMAHQSSYPVHVGGRLWLARSHKYWQYNTGLSPKQIITALKYLKAHKIVVSYLYNSMHLACSHYRINRIVASLVPIFCDNSPPEVFFGPEFEPWYSHKEGQPIQKIEYLHEGFAEGYKIAKQENDLLPPSGKLWDVNSENENDSELEYI